MLQIISVSTLVGMLFFIVQQPSTISKLSLKELAINKEQVYGTLFGSFQSNYLAEEAPYQAKQRELYVKHISAVNAESVPDESLRILGASKNVTGRHKSREPTAGGLNTNCLSLLPSIPPPSPFILFSHLFSRSLSLSLCFL